MTFTLVLLISVSFSSFSQLNESANLSKTQPKKTKSSATYLDTYIQQLSVQSCFLVSVIFEVEDLSGNPISDAVVTFNESENIAGDYFFNEIEVGTYAFSVKKAGYISVDGEVIVNLESSEHFVGITLLVETFTIAFNVVDAQENEIADAIVTFNSVANEPGNYTFEGIEAGTYNYRVEKDGYITVESQAEVIDQNITINVTLSIVTSITPTQLTEQWISLYPNPNTGQFNIELSLKPTESNISITVLDTTGRVVYRFQVTAEGETFSKELQLSFLSKGMYYIHVQVDQRTVVKKLIIK